MKSLKEHYLKVFGTYQETNSSNVEKLEANLDWKELYYNKENLYEVLLMKSDSKEFMQLIREDKGKLLLAPFFRLIGLRKASLEEPNSLEVNEEFLFTLNFYYPEYTEEVKRQEKIVAHLKNITS